MDVLQSFAATAMAAPIEWIRPHILEDTERSATILKGIRHPCLEAQEADYIANDVSMCRDDSEFLIITGPNMGGKSTYMRSIGCVVLLAQIGSFVPCSVASLPCFDSILARLGAGDSMARGISTFMMEMIETGSILKVCAYYAIVRELSHY